MLWQTNRTTFPASKCILSWFCQCIPNTRDYTRLVVYHLDKYVFRRYQLLVSICIDPSELYSTQMSKSTFIFPEQSSHHLISFFFLAKFFLNSLGYFFLQNLPMSSVQTNRRLASIGGIHQYEYSTMRYKKRANK